MSYEILYGRQFVSLENGTYVPMILSGSSNCTMYHNGREIRERHWWPLGSQDLMGKSEAELLDWIKTRTQDNPDSEWFMRGSKWMTGKSMLQWMTNSIRSARTIEDIIHHVPYQSLRCCISVYDNNKKYGERGYQTNECEKYIHTTKDLQLWIDGFNRRYENIKENETIYPCMEFSGIEPLKIGSAVKSDNPVICKIGNGYLSEFEIKEHGSSYTYCPDIASAIVFENTDDFISKTKGLRLSKYRLVKADQPAKNFVIKIDAGCYRAQYVKKKTSRRLLLSFGVETAMRFASEKAAQRYIDDKLVGHYPSCNDFVVEKITKE